MGKLSMNNSQAVSYIGKTVYAFGNTINVSEGSSNTVNFDLASNAQSVYVNIYDEGGNLVRNIQSGAMDIGENQISWDGINTDGETVEGGNYEFEVFAFDYDDNYVDTVSYMENRITGVSYYNNQPYLNSEDIKIPLASVFKVSENINESAN